MAILSEEQIVKGFHSILQDSLSQARGEGLLSDEDLETADVDVQVAGPALALYFAALGARGDPSSISSPDQSFSLTSQNCPETFRSAFSLWQAAVRPIQHLPSEARHDLALMLCDKPALSSPLRTDVARLAGDLKGIALEILQRRTFQTRYQNDLQAALDSAVRPRTSGESARHQTQYEPPPMYAEGQPTEETKQAYGHLNSPGERSAALDTPAQNVEAALPLEHQENLTIIRETLYSALADSIIETPSILQQLSRGPEWAAKAFFAATCLAILEVALSRMDRSGVHAVDLGRNAPKVIGPGETPSYLRPFLAKLVEVSQAVQALAEEDNERAIREASEGVEQLTPPKLERLKERLSEGVGAPETVTSSRISADGQVAQLANAVNALALGMSSLPAFRERQAEAFKILAAVSRL
ncbi:hypothetical protein JCM11641_003770 [Rhodosporidiobolus odoratus]